MNKPLHQPSIKINASPLRLTDTGSCYQESGTVSKYCIIDISTQCIKAMTDRSMDYHDSLAVLGSLSRDGGENGFSPDVATKVATFRRRKQYARHQIRIHG